MALFERIERAVYAAELSEASSYGLWVILSNASERWRKPDDLLQPLVDTIPALRFLLDELARDRAELARCIGMSLAVVTTRLHTFETQRHLSHLVAQSLQEQRPE